MPHKISVDQRKKHFFIQIKPCSVQKGIVKNGMLYATTLCHMKHCGPEQMFNLPHPAYRIKYVCTTDRKEKISCTVLLFMYNYFTTNTEAGRHCQNPSASAVYHICMMISTSTGYAETTISSLNLCFSKFRPARIMYHFRCRPFVPETWTPYHPRWLDCDG